MTTEKKTGWLLITGAVGVFIPYIILTMIFEYPDILRQDTAVILSKFHNGGSSLIFTWWAFAILFPSNTLLWIGHETIQEINKRLYYRINQFRFMLHELRYN